MMRRSYPWAVILLASMSMGCAMCQAPLDHHYAAYGGVRDRLDRVHGRVGSLFDPAPSLQAPTLDAAPTLEEAPQLEEAPAPPVES